MTAKLTAIDRGQNVLDALTNAGAVLPLPRHQASAQSVAGATLGLPHVVLTAGDDVQPEPISWLMPGWLARGKLHILAGPAGTGKTTVALALAAALSTSGRWPSGDRAPKARTLIWSGEDDPKDTLVPRLLACGADMSMVSFIGGVSDGQGVRPFDPALDVPLLTDTLARLDDVSLVLVDPIVSAVATDSHKNGEVRRALQPMVDMANAKGCAVLGISHFSKGTAGREPVERVTGSLAFAALARVVLVAAKVQDPVNGQTWRLLARAKSNIGPDDGGWKYELEQAEVPEYPGLMASRVLWGDAVEGSARELLGQAEQAESPEDREQRLSATGFLQTELAGGPRDAKEILAEGERQGFPRRTLQYTANRLMVKRSKPKFDGGWVWALPEDASTTRRREGATPDSFTPSCAFGTETMSSDNGEVL